MNVLLCRKPDEWLFPNEHRVGDKSIKHVCISPFKLGNYAAGCLCNSTWNNNESCNSLHIFLQLSSSQTLPQLPKCIIMKLFRLHFCHLCWAAGYEALSLCALCLQEGQQSGERGDQSLPGEQEDLSGSGGTSYRLVTDTLSHVTRISRFLLPCHVRSSSLLTLAFEELCVIVKSLCPDPEDMSACCIIVDLGCPLNTDKAPDFTHLCQWTFFVCLHHLTQNNTRSFLHVELFLTDWRGVMCTHSWIHYEVSLFVGFFFERFPQMLTEQYDTLPHPPRELCLQCRMNQISTCCRISVVTLQCCCCCAGHWSWIWPQHQKLVDTEPARSCKGSEGLFTRMVWFLLTQENVWTHQHVRMFSPFIPQMCLRNKVHVGGRCSGLVENMENFTLISWLLARTFHSLASQNVKDTRLRQVT